MKKTDDKVSETHTNYRSEVTFPNREILQSLSGEANKSLKIIEKELDVEIGLTSKGLTVRGVMADVELASDLLTQLRDLVGQGEQLFNGDIERALEMLSANRALRLSELFRDQVTISGRKRKILPKTFNQKTYLEAIRENDVVFGIGPAGTGKTFLAMAMAVAQLLRKEVKRIVLSRPAVEAGEKLGFLPGDLAEKVNPYLRPLYDALHDMVEYEHAQEMVQKGIIEVAPLAFMRGRTLSNSFVILDEAQNTTNGQMKMLLTRLGQGSKLVVTGDITQVDLPRGESSGLIDALRILENVEGIGAVHFTDQDVIRHKLVARIVKAYESRS